VPTKVPTVREYLEYWLREVIRPNRAPLTYATYETLCRLYLLPGLGSKRLDRLTVRSVQSCLNRDSRHLPVLLPGQGRPPVGEEEALLCGGEVLPVCALGTDGSRRADCSAFGPVRRHRGGTDHKERRGAREGTGRPTSEGASVVKRGGSDLLGVRPIRGRSALCGVRVGPRARAAQGRGARLGWEDVDLAAHHVNVGWQVRRVGRQLLRRETKTEASDAGLPLPTICVTALEQRREAQVCQRTRAGEAWIGASDVATGLVFTGAYGTPVEPRTFNRAFGARCVGAGVRGITVHDARRTCATLLVDLEVHPPGDHANSPTCAVRSNDGDLRAGVLRGDPGSPQAPGRRPRRAGRRWQWGIGRCCTSRLYLRCAGSQRPGSAHAKGV
jgi:hypothetical protein